MATVESILANKGHAVYSLPPQATILDALKLMAEKEIGAVLVMEGEDVKGIFSERDYARRGTLVGNPITTPLKDVMTQRIFYVSPEQSAETCMAQMSDKHIRHLPVLKDKKVVGVISVGDIVKSVLKDKDATIQGLENFILGQELQQ
jgi:CBS domain-containing protein